MRILIVNADDFGRTAAINRGIAKAHREGIVTSTSVMVRWPAAAEAAEYVARFPRLSFGLHCDFGEWVYRQDEWQQAYAVIPIDDEAAIATELDRQLAVFSAIMKRPPTHLDTHQHVHKREPVKSILRQKALELQIPLRGDTPEINFCGAFYGQTDRGEPIPDSLGVEQLAHILAALPDGTTELSCHPGEIDDWSDAYKAERVHELATLCDPRLRQTLTALNIVLASFSNYTNWPQR